MYKIVVFDLVETIGNFLELSTFIEALENLYKKELKNNELFKLFDIVPDIFRPNIFKIFKYLIKKKKQNKKCKIMIYTNNQGPKSWTESIAKYIEHKLNTKIFDQIIGAYKVDGVIIEKCRTTHDKTKTDFLKCTKLPENSQICFIDDQFHEYMNTTNIYYLNVKPYLYQYSANEIAERYYNVYKPNMNKHKFMDNIISYMKMYKAHFSEWRQKPEKQINIDKIIGKQILISIKDFFKQKNHITRKRLKKIKSVKDYEKQQKNKTRKLSKRSKKKRNK